MSNVLHIDFETRSACDLRAQGVSNYAAHPTTDLLCLGYAFDDEDPSVWVPSWEQEKRCESLTRLFDHIVSGGRVFAHNAAFEFVIWNNVGRRLYDFPELKIEQLHCTMVEAYAMGLPGSLEKAAPALGLDIKKDTKGNRVMFQLCKPRKVNPRTGEITWWEDDEKFQTVVEYCKQDVRVERALERRLMRLQEKERQVYCLDRRINDRGIPIDLDAVEAAIAIVDKEKKRLNDEMQLITGNAVATCQASIQIKDFLNANGVEVPGVTKADIDRVLNKEDLPPKVKRVAELRREAAKSSTAKLIAMRNKADQDGRARGTMQYHAASTGRWGGRGIQVQNFPRPELGQSDIDHIIELIKTVPTVDAINLIESLYGPPTPVLSSCLRGMFTATEGKIFIGGDWSAIEARVLSWLADETEDLKVFHQDGEIYERAARDIFGLPSQEPVQPNQRQIGKVATLALGYQGGKGAFQTMAKNYGMIVTDDEAEQIKDAWRNSHRQVVKYWYELEKAAVRAVANPGTMFLAGPSDSRGVQYLVKGSFLWCRLPSGRVLCYPYPNYEPVMKPWGEESYSVTYKTVDSYTNKWERKPAYGGLFCENITQACARDVLADALLRAEGVGLNVVMHVHDEILCEEPDDGSVDEGFLERLMCEVPEWAHGLPLRAEAWSGKRYQK